MINRTDLEHFFHRRETANKYDMGHVLVLGGEHGTVGAPLLAGQAALRTGAGLVTLGVPKDLTSTYEGRVLELLTLQLPTAPGDLQKTLGTFITSRKVNVICLGSGLSANHALRYLHALKNIHIPLIIDAGGIAAFQGKLSELDSLAKQTPVILTPHTGEFQRLTHATLPTNEQKLQTVASKFSTQHHVTLVLKKHATLVASANGKIYQNNTGNPGLATAGVGDVLAGIIAGIIAQGIEPIAAASFGVYIHGLIGDQVAKDNTQPGVIASDIITNIPSALHNIAAAYSTL